MAPQPVTANLLEMRIDLRDPTETHIYMLIQFDREPPEPFKTGWHHKAFPAGIGLPTLFKQYMQDHMTWEIKAPPICEATLARQEQFKNHKIIVG